MTEERETPGRKPGMAPWEATTHGQDNETRALNALKALRAAPISMGRGEIPVEPPPAAVRFLPLMFFNTVLVKGDGQNLGGVDFEHERHSYLAKIHALHRGGVQILPHWGEVAP